jgi:peptidoglycan/xylan/chitin deacetylase (PgdA/CDA1 family)
MTRMLGLLQDRILMYHGTPRRDAEALERQLRLVSLAFPVVPLQELPYGRGRARVALTFDDGLRNNVEVAYPILKKLGLTATFFVCPGLIEGRRWLWNHEARQRLMFLGKSPAQADAMVERMKAMKIARRREAEEAIRKASAGFVPSAAQHEEFDLATWDELRSMDPSVVTIGSHTMTHPILTSLSDAETEAETRDSRIAIENRMQRAVSIFCYPNGDLNDGALASARRYYHSAVTVEKGTLHQKVDPHLMPRYAAHAQWTRRLARRMLVG